MIMTTIRRNYFYYYIITIRRNNYIIYVVTFKISKLGSEILAM